MGSIFFDLETNGLPSRIGVPYGHYPPITDRVKYEDARVVQISYMVCDDDLNTLSMHDSIIDTEGRFGITNSHIHGITDERSRSSGEAFDDVMVSFVEALRGVGTVVAHNADFDVNVLKAELYRRGSTEALEVLCQKRVVCTMKLCKAVVNAKNVYHRLKNPSLKELYEFATQKQMEGAHDARYDVLNMHEAVKSLLDRGMIAM